MMTRKTCIILALCSAVSCHAIETVNTKGFGNKAAIKGYDPVAYFLRSSAVKGSKEIEYEWMGATWRFSSRGSRDIFAAHPEKYAPQYGGYCAYAMASGKTAAIDPDQFTILNGKLYLNYSEKVNSIWSENREEFIRKADQQWKALLEQ